MVPTLHQQVAETKVNNLFSPWNRGFKLTKTAVLKQRPNNQWYAKAHKGNMQMANSTFSTSIQGPDQKTQKCSNPQKDLKSGTEASK
jgi:hypothetical protein